MSVQDHISQAKSQINNVLNDLQEKLGTEPGGAPSGGGTNAQEIGKLRDFCYEMGDALSQQQIASVLLKASFGVMERAILFIVKGATLSSWQGVGLKGVGSPLEKVAVNIPANSPSILQKVVTNKVGYLENFEPSPGNNQIVQGLGSGKPTMMAAIPMVANEQVRLILYGDNAHSQQPMPDIANLEILMVNAELGMENVNLKKKLGQQVTQKPPKPRRPISSGSASAPAPAPVQQSTPTPPQPTSTPTSPPQQQTPSPQPKPQAPPQQQEPVGFTSQPPKTQVSGLEGMDESERKQHEEAKAFASVIVSDIFLYNQPKIEEGLKNGSLDQLLGGEFERGRRLYMQRVSPAIAKNTNYYDEAIETMVQKKKKILNL